VGATFLPIFTQQLADDCLHFSASGLTGDPKAFVKAIGGAASMNS
jgi:hypothetical protein